MRYFVKKLKVHQWLDDVPEYLLRYIDIEEKYIKWFNEDNLNETCDNITDVKLFDNQKSADGTFFFWWHDFYREEMKKATITKIGDSYMLDTIVIVLVRDGEREELIGVAAPQEIEFV